MTPKDRRRIEHMIEAGETALRFLGNLTAKDLKEDQKSLFAVIRAVEIMGEAAARVSEETRNEHTQIPWRDITAMRNRLIHGYFDIDTVIVWNTVSNEIPMVIPDLKALISVS